MKRTTICSVLAALLLAVLAILFFFPDDIEGNVLQQHDMVQGIANGQEGKAFTEATGETTRWTNSLFSGMPNFQIAPSYAAEGMLSWVASLYRLWLPSPANLLFAMMLGFFIMCLCMDMKWYTALFASVAWGFSTYFIIIIGAGHIWKFVTLSYIPPTIGGIVLCYRGKYLGGTALTALFGALQLMGNHPQMSYYFLFVIVAMVLAWLYISIRSGRLAQWGIATGCCVVAGLLAVAVNSASLYNTYEYAKETVRGRATELTTDAPGGDTGGMDRAAITAWSYGLDETFTLLIPNVKGGATIKPEGGNNRLLSLADTEKADELNISTQERQLLGQLPQYFGDQPMTNGPVYVGAFVLVLAVLAMFICHGPVFTPMKWALFAVSILAILLAWGHNFSGLTDFFIDSFPGYNRFRAVASILVIVEFTLPLLAAMAIVQLISNPKSVCGYTTTFYAVAGTAAGLCLIGWLAPEIFGNTFSAPEREQFGQMGILSDPAYANVWRAVRETRLSLVKADAIRSFFFILIGSLLVMLYIKGALRNKAMFVCSLTAVVLIDLFTVNKRYVNSNSFIEPAPAETVMTMTDADRAILQDTAMNYRVMDVGGFGDARSSYFHKTIGGYHAAKLTRYNDLINHQIVKGNPAILNMLNAKYILNGNEYQVNPDALGNAWLVERIGYVDTPDAEMAALDTLDTSYGAVAAREWQSVLGEAHTVQPGDTIYETTYTPNRLTYKARTADGGLAVFSEIFFPWGWTATVDGSEVPIGRVNYVLRAVKLPAGEHTVEFRFDPRSLKVTNTVSRIAVFIIYALCIYALIKVVLCLRNRRSKGTDENDNALKTDKNIK